MTDDPRIPPEDDELMRQADALIDGANTHEGRSRIGLLDSWVLLPTVRTRQGLFRKDPQGAC